jgi:hypothetical protein
MRWFTYEPIVPCRTDMYGERIFVDHWQRMMREPLRFGDGEPNEKFASIVSPWFPIADDAAAASSFISWLGTSCGRTFLHVASRLAEDNPKLTKGQPYVLAWASENQRLPGWNGNRRLIEAILPRDKLALRSIEMVEIVVWWLGSPDGQRLISEAEAEIEETSRQVREQNAIKSRATEHAADLIERGAA